MTPPAVPVCRVWGCRSPASWRCDFGWRLCDDHRKHTHMAPDAQKSVPAKLFRYPSPSPSEKEVRG